MSNKLTWKNPTIQADSIVIYRSASRIERNALPAPLATIPGTAVEYVDTTNLLNVPYFYRIGRVKGTDIALSKNICLQERAVLGPGPQTLLRGDFETGYFGTLPASEFFTTADLSTLAGMTMGTVLEGNPTWHKFAHNGKIKYLPSKILRYGSGITWNSLYSAGLVFGTDTPASELITTSTAPAPRSQDVKVTRDNLQYRVRLLQFLKPGQTTTAGITDAYRDAGKGSEFQQLLCRMTYDVNGQGSDGWHNDPKLASLLATDIFSTYQAPGANFSRFGVIYNLTQLRKLVGEVGNNATSTTMAWYPVLEMVD